MMHRTPAQMREDSCMWARSAYPEVAIGRYRDAADQIEQVERAVTVLRHQRDQFAARYESASALLSDILAHVAPTHVTLEDGRTMGFVDPDPQRTLKLVQAAIARALEAARTRPDAEATAAVPGLRGKKAIVLYFDTDEDRDELVAAIHEAKPTMRAVKL